MVTWVRGGEIQEKIYITEIKTFPNCYLSSTDLLGAGRASNTDLRRKRSVITPGAVIRNLIIIN
jgi:hypothetical protein